MRALVLGALGAWAGCTGPDPPSGDSTSRSGTSTEPTSGRTSTVPGTSESTTNTPQSLKFSNPTVQTGIATQWEDTIEVRGGGQYFTVEATVDGEDHGPPLGAFEFVFDGERHEPYDPENVLAVPPLKYRADTGGGRIVFRLPEQGLAGTARLVWPGGEWTPTEDVRERLASPLPTFDVRVSAPDEIEGFERPTLSIAVTNEGDVPGRHVVGVDQKGPGGYFATVGRFAFDLAPGETETRTHTGSPPGWDGGPRQEIVYTVHLPNGALGRTIRPPDEETTSRE